MFNYKMNYVGIWVLLLLIIPVIFAATDYCQANICARGKKHIACGNNGKFAHICDFPEIVNITRDYRKQIVQKHNSLRNKIAKGFSNFPPAGHMATMLWNNELAKLAELNVKQCELRYDQCRNTKKFPNVAQNIAIIGWDAENFTISEIIDGQIEAWFYEYKECPLDVIKSYKSSNVTYYSHFTAIVQDKSNRIGCAILRSVSHGLKQQMMACNYAYDNMLGEPVYIPAQTASLCVTGTNRVSTSLCSIRESYNLEKRCNCS